MFPMSRNIIRKLSTTRPGLWRNFHCYHLDEVKFKFDSISVSVNYCNGNAFLLMYIQICYQVFTLHMEVYHVQHFFFPKVDPDIIMAFYRATEI